MTNEPKIPLNFVCRISRKSPLSCGHKFETSDYTSDPYPEREWHPWKYSADCPSCGMQAEHASWELAQWKAIHDNGRTGAVTEQGRIRISEANRARDPESYAVSRFNSIKHGMSSRVAKYFPARPGHYDQCEGCEYLFNGCGDPMPHCAKRTEIFVQHALAQEEGDGSLLGPLMAETQAGLSAVLADMLRSIAKKGVLIETPEFFIDKETHKVKLVEYEDEFGRKHRLTRSEANPLLQPLIALIKSNNITLGDMGLTPRAKEEEKRFVGFLEDKEADRETVMDASRDIKNQMASLREMLGSGPKIANGEVIDVEDAQFEEVPD